MPKYVIERDMPGVGSLPPEALREAAKGSNAALATLAPRVQWQHSYVSDDKLFCVYVADNEELIREHAHLAGVPANAITRVSDIIDPTTAEG